MSQIESAQFPDLHDGDLAWIEWSSNHLSLKFLEIDGMEVCIRLSNVTLFRLNNLQERNIVDEVLFFDRDDFENKNQSTLQRWVEYLHLGHELKETLPGYEELSRQIDKILSEIRSGKSRLFVMSSSYGCEIVALFREARIKLGERSCGKPHTECI